MVTQNGLVRIVEQVAAEQVAGSMLRVMVGDETYLFEAGSEMTHGKKPFPLTPEQIKALQNTTFGHGHGDHILRTLELIAKGFNGKFYSTHQTAAIAKIQFREEASGPFIHNKMVAGKTFQYGPKKGQPLPKQPFEFRSEDVNAAMAMFASLDGQEPGFPYETDIEIGDGVTIKFYEAGHIPGAAQTMYKISKGGKKINVLFAYDLGRTDYKILGHPVADIPLVKFPTTDFDEQIDYIVIEATYGNRIHRPLQESLTALTEAAREAEKNKGVLVIPAFSIMRTQMLWNFLFELEQKGQLPDDMIFYSSSPMADQVARIMLSHKEDFNRQAMAEFQSANDNPFYFPKLVHQKTGKETAETIAELMG